MQITAKFPGTCASCRCAIKAGEKIEWQKGAASRHVICPAGGTPVAPSAKCAGVRCGKSATTSVPDTEGNGRIPFCADCARSMGVATPRVSTPTRRGRPWRPCGYPGCNPSYCDECDCEGS